MRKYIFEFIILITQVVFTNLAFSQESNSNENYSDYLPEVRTFNKELSMMPQTVSVLTKDGLAEERKMMESHRSAQIVLQPTVKYIKGPGGDLALRIFKPDTIHAV